MWNARKCNGNKITVKKGKPDQSWNGKWWEMSYPILWKENECQQRRRMENLSISSTNNARILYCKIANESALFTPVCVAWLTSHICNLFRTAIKCRLVHLPKQEIVFWYFFFGKNYEHIHPLGKNLYEICESFEVFEIPVLSTI